jgi:hypothetical protein
VVTAVVVVVVVSVVVVVVVGSSTVVTERVLGIIVGLETLLTEASPTFSPRPRCRNGGVHRVPIARRRFLPAAQLPSRGGF